MIQVKAPQISYPNEIAELIKVFYPEEPDPSHPADKVLETGFRIEHITSYTFFAILWEGDTLINEHQIEVSIDGTDANKSNVDQSKEDQSKEDQSKVDVRKTDQDNAGQSIVTSNSASQPSEKYGNKTNRFIKNGIKGCVFDLLEKVTGKHPKWGAMTGIRPVKLVHELFDKGLDEAYAKQELIKVYKLHPEKADLLIRTAGNQRPFIDQRGNNKAAVYIHIPFCSTRCLYCSFPSDLISRVSGKMDAYLDCLEMEMAAVIGELTHRGRYIDTVYIGGGTPTVLEHHHLERLLRLVKEHILSRFSILEYTVEAGRPDSLDRNKLALMKENGVTRISINPQSMNQETLDLVGRSHKVEDIVHIYNLARELEFDSINMDVILGLPGETAEHMTRTMEGIAALEPENITVHTLSVKRASVLKEGSFHQYEESRKGLAEDMAAVCRNWIKKQGMEPYYLYRQKYMLDHLENIGYALPGKECLYNIQFMDEKRDIWAFGAGASSKIYHPKEDRLERIGNVKNLDAYLSRIEEMIERKQKVLFYRT